MEWFNAVDLTCRADLRELNELTRQRTETLLASQVNFARFDAKLEQRIAQSEARMERRLGELDVRLERIKAELIRWMSLFWVGSVELALGVNALG